MYQDLIVSFKTNPRDIHTVPVQAGSTPVWFYAFTKDGFVYVESGHTHVPKSNIKVPIKLDLHKYETMLSIYHRRQKGESVSVEAKHITHNQVYWYGIFADLNL